MRTRVTPVDGHHTVIDEYTIESEMFGERFCHSGRPAAINTFLVQQAGFDILFDKIDQPGNQVVLAKISESVMNTR